jgi:dTDP-glucose pyrophosphorylase
MKDITILSGATIREAMEAMDKTSEKILLVVDDERRLIGALSDGDIRRYILKGGDLTGSINDAYQTEPISVFEDAYNIAEIKSLLTKNRIGLIPVLDRSRKIVDFLTWEGIFGDQGIPERNCLDAPVVIMAGGRGSRLEPFTRVLPKPLVPIGDKTVLDHIIDNFRVYGVEHYYLTVHHMSKIIKAYFEEKQIEYTVHFTEEDEPRGTAGSLKLLSEQLIRPFFVSNCDIMIQTDYADLYAFHLNKGFDITLVASAKKFSIPYGICELNGGGSLRQIKEKPEYNFLVNTGLYVLNPEVIAMIPDHGSFHMTQLIRKIQVNGGSAGVYPISENSWIDVGQWAEYRNALKLMEGM